MSDTLLARLALGQLDDEVLGAALAELERRRRPVSLPGLCNALWFVRGRAGGYDGPALDELLGALRTFGHVPEGEQPLRPQPAVPVGALVTVETGIDIAYGEVVWKEGAHPLLNPAWVPGWLAGAPSGAPLDAAPSPAFAPGLGERVLRERVVVDFTCLGVDLGPTETQLFRLRGRGRRLDRFGHLIAEVAYTDGLDEADEVAFWAAWTARNHPRALAAAGVEANPAVLAEAASILAAALDDHPGVRSFGPYYITAHIYNGIVAADDADRRDLRRTVRGLARLSSHDSVGWASMSARLADTCPEGALLGTGWPTAVVCGSLLALDTLAAEAPDGDWQGMHLRLDDAWQGGGLWRAERLDATFPVDADPAVALGLGWATHTGGEIARAVPNDAEVDAPDWYAGDVDDLELSITGSDVAWVAHLSAADIDTDRLRLPLRVSTTLAETLYGVDQDRLLVIVRHDGEPEQREWVALADDGHLELAWPLGILPGTTVRVSWQVAATLVVAATTLLGAPEEVAGITYHHEFNLALALAAAGATEPASRTVTLRQLVRAAVRRHGGLTEDGCVALGLDAIVERCFGPSGEVSPGFQRAVLRRAVVAAAAGMAATGAVSLDGDLVVLSPRLTQAGRGADAELLARFVEASRQRLRRHAQRHWVPPTVVNLPPSRRRSASKDAGWSTVAGTDGLPHTDLAPNQTWRRGHVRGQVMSPEVTAELERVKHSLTRLGVGEADLDEAVADPYAEWTPPSPQRPGAIQ